MMMGDPEEDIAVFLWVFGAVTILVVGVFIWLGSSIHTDAVATQKMGAAAPYHEGDIVRSKIAKFRGMITQISCSRTECMYGVRFYQASMEPQWVYAYEIERAK